MKNKHFLRAFAIVASLTPSLPALALGWPEKTVVIITPYAPGGGTDILARILAAKLTERLGKPFLVENRPGATGNTGSAAVSRSKPDGQTLLLGTAANFSINQHLFKKLPYDQAALTPVSILVDYPNVMVVNRNSTIHTVKELIDDVKKRPGELNFGSPGIGASGHLTMEMFNKTAGLKMTHVPYKGTGPAVNALLTEEVQVNFDALAAYLPFIRAGKFRALAVSTETRSPALPDVPTVSEAGLGGFAATAWFALAMPAGAPAELIRKINSEFAATLKDPAVRKQLLQNGFNLRGDTVEATAKFVGDESVKWGEVVKASGAALVAD